MKKSTKNQKRAAYAKLNINRHSSSGKSLSTYICITSEATKAFFKTLSDYKKSFAKDFHKNRVKINEDVSVDELIVEKILNKKKS